MKKIRVPMFIAALAVVLAVGFTVTTEQAAAADPFLCPIVGDGVNTADSHNGDNGVEAINPAAGTSLLPGNNKAGENADPNAHNSSGLDDPDAGPGGNPDFSPIWPG